MRLPESTSSMPDPAMNTVLDRMYTNRLPASYATLSFETPKGPRRRRPPPPPSTNLDDAF